MITNNQIITNGDENNFEMEKPLQQVMYEANLINQNKVNSLIYAEYTRKSSEPKERQALSIDEQKLECEKYIKLTGITVAEEFKFEESKSAFKPDLRPVFNRMIELIQTGQINAILTWSPNRLCRNPKEGGIILQMLQDGILKEIRTTAGDIYTPDSDLLVLQIHFGMANQYPRNLSRDVKRGLVHKCERGEYPRPAPIGFVGSGERGGRNIKPDKFAAPIILDSYKLAATAKYSLSALGNYTFEKGLRTRKGKKLGKSQMYSILTNPVYYGYFYQNGQIYKGNFKPIVSKDLYDQVQAALRVRSKPILVEWDDINHWNGLATCYYCHCSITTTHKEKHYKRTNRTAVYNYLNCTKRRGKCQQKPLTQEEFEKELLENVKGISIDQEAWSLGINILKEKYKHEANERTIRHKHFEEQNHKIQKRLDGLIAMRADDEITKEEFIRQKNDLLKEQARLESLLKDTKSSALSWLELTEKFLDTSLDAQNIMQNGTPEDKRELILTVGENLSLKDGKVYFTFRKPYDVLLKPTYRTEWLEERNFNITTYLAQTIKVFENFKLMSELRQELDKLKSPISFVPTTTQITN